MSSNPLKKEKILILYNLGTPSSLDLKDIKKYLFQFLMDPCVIDVVFPLRLFLVGAIIIPFRAPQTKKSYEAIWTSDGSPLLSISRNQAKKLQQFNKIQTEVVMRYGKPSLKSVLKKLKNQITQKYIKNQDKQYELTFIPLYPQAALSTTESVYREIEKYFSKFQKGFKKEKLNIEKKIIPPFFDHPDYIEILKKSIEPYIEKIKKPKNHLLFSYHGVPKRHIHKTDPGYPSNLHCLKQKNCCDIKAHPHHPAHVYCYHFQTKRTTELIVEKLSLKTEQYSHSYQSRLGRDPWLTPYTDETIKHLAQNGIKKLWVVCPAFVTDNLETLFEIQIENEELFQENGGETLKLIPCLNDQDDLIHLLHQLQQEASLTTT